MGRNKDLKRKIAGRARVIEEHEEEIGLAADLEVEIAVLKSKAEHAHEALEEFEELLPEGN